MDAYEKKGLLQEAKLQSEALKRIKNWRTMAVGVSTIGVACFYAGFLGGRHLIVGIAGVAVLLLGICAAVVFDRGLRNGRRNVEKMLHVLNGAKDGL